MNIAMIGMPGTIPAPQTSLQQLAAAIGDAPSFGLVLQAAAPALPAASVQPSAPVVRAQPLLLAGSAIATAVSAEALPVTTPAKVASPIAEPVPETAESAAALPVAAPVDTASTPDADVRPKTAGTAHSVLQPLPAAPSPMTAPASNPLPAPAPVSATPLDAQKPSDQLAVQDPTDDIQPLDIPVPSEPIVPDAPVIAAQTSPAPPAPNVMAAVPMKGLAAGPERGGIVSEAVSTSDTTAQPVAPAAVAGEASTTSAPVEARAPTPAPTTADAPRFEPVRSEAPALTPALPRTEAAPAPIGDRFQPEPLVREEPVIAARPGQLGRDMGVEIARHVVAGKDEVVIRLNPVELGRIEVRMSFDETGSLRAVLTAESSAALDMLRRDAGDLGRTLAEAGVRADLDSFKFANRGGGDGAQPGWSNREHSGARDDRGQRNDRERTMPGETTHDPDHRLLPASGRVDLMA